MAVCKMIQKKNPRRDALSPLATGEDLDPIRYPMLYNISAAFTMQFIPRPNKVKSPEFVYLDHNPLSRKPDHEGMAFLLEWNMTWEAAQLRSQLHWRKIPSRWKALRKIENQNIYLLPEMSGPRYQAYAPLFHLLPRRVLERFGLPLLKQGSWPYTLTHHYRQKEISRDFNHGLQQAFACYIWKLINPRGGLSAFSKFDSIKILAHNLDYWLPYACQVAQRRLGTFKRVPIENEKQRQTKKELQAQLPAGIREVRPRMGGAIWCGEEDAWTATKELVESADAHGRLRGIMEAIRSHRVQDDFSNRWSYVREDFERKLYKKRRKIKIRFVELDETIPVHGPDSEVEEGTLWEDFMGLLDTKERSVVVLLRSGMTKVGDIGKELGYANHSPVSKALARIRNKAKRYFENTR